MLLFHVKTKNLRVRLVRFSGRDLAVYSVLKKMSQKQNELVENKKTKGLRTEENERAEICVCTYKYVRTTKRKRTCRSFYRKEESKSSKHLILQPAKRYMN